MKKSRIAAILLSTVCAFGSVSVLGACGGQNNGKTAEVVYHLNYNDAGERRVEIPSGSQACDWKAPRAGFKIKDWYTDKKCTKEYDFTQKVTGTLNLYADWTVDAGKAKVTFNYNYPGCRSPLTVSVDKNGKIAERYVPEKDDVSRLGMELDKWYKDAKCTQEWNFESDTVDADITLYAGYEAANTVMRDESGNIKYENVTVNLWLDGDSRDKSLIFELAQEFNKEYSGKITVDAREDLPNQSAFSLRMQPTPKKSENESTYYSVHDIYAMAEIEYSLDDWYEGAIEDSIHKGALTSVPLFASVPYVIYNKQLMQKYSPNKLPSNYSELSAVLKAAYADQKNNSGFKTFITDVSWKYKEGASAAAFLQNGAEYYRYDRATSMYVNEWENANVKAGVKNALQNTYNLFGVNGDCHGGTIGGDQPPVDTVKEGKALMAIVNYMYDQRPQTANDDKIGIMSLSGLFTDNTDAASKRIPVNTVGLAFYKAADVNHTQLAAAAVFADWCSKNSYKYTKDFWYPIRKDCADPEKFDSNYKKYLLQVGSPENFYTFSAYNNGKNIVNKIAAEKYVVPLLSNEEFGSEALNALVEDMTVALGFEINN